RHLTTLVIELYGVLQTRLDGQDPFDGLKPLFSKAIPLERDGSICSVEPQKTGAIYVDDDPVRRRFIAGLRDIYIIPKLFEETYDVLIEAFRVHLGQKAVVRV